MKFKTQSLCGKTVAMTGCTGGLGRELCHAMAGLGASLILLDRNQQKSQALEQELTESFSELRITRIPCELEDMESVRAATENLIAARPDIFIANAGAYSIPRRITASGYDNVFQINFVSPYYMVRRLREELEGIRILAVGSIAHSYSRLDPEDIDFRTRKSAAKVYGNSKRCLMLSLGELFREDCDRLAVVHPGITFTNITAHYPKVIFAVIKYPMKLIFMSPKKAARCLLAGLWTSTPHGTWIGPSLFGIWGKPRLQKLRAARSSDSQPADEIAQRVYEEIKSKSPTHG